MKNGNDTNTIVLKNVKIFSKNSLNRKHPFCYHFTPYLPIYNKGYIKLPIYNATCNIGYMHK